MAEFRTLPETLLHRVQVSASKVAFRFPTASGWADLTWAQTGLRVRNIACGLRSLGVAPQQRVAILANTRVDWVLADLGILCAGAATTTIYPSNTAAECAYILSDSETVVVFAEDAGQTAKLQSILAEAPTTKTIVTFDGKASGDGKVITLADLEAMGETWNNQNVGAYEAGVQAVQAEDLATLIYTSGTTGVPKGVELTHDCWVFEGKALDELGLIKEDDLQYVWLPLAHS